jgi:small subunit ribosomal protein S17
MNMNEGEQSVEAKRLRRTKVGAVVSDKMDKTVVVLVERKIKHPMFHKYYARSKKYMAHDETGISHVGDKVLIVETRPQSKRKRWKVKEVLSKAEVEAQ